MKYKRTFAFLSIMLIGVMTMAKADMIKMLKTAKQVLIGFTGPNREPIYLTPDFAQQLAEALEDMEPGTTQVTKGFAPIAIV
jgi:hypothetical protein